VLARARTKRSPYGATLGQFYLSKEQSARFKKQKPGTMAG
jgi:hypothetical protein